MKAAAYWTINQIQRGKQLELKFNFCHIFSTIHIEMCSNVILLKYDYKYRNIVQGCISEHTQHRRQPKQHAPVILVGQLCTCNVFNIMITIIYSC